MKKVRLILSAVVMTTMILSSCGEGASNEVTIDKQVWLNENLNVDKFRNGDPIPEAKIAADWEAAGKNKEPVWCYYDNDPANGTKYGKLYNWYAVNDPRGLAPRGYHIPSAEEWTILKTLLGGEDVAGVKMKSKQGWYGGGNGINSSGFTGLPGGYRSFNGSFGAIGEYGFWWSSAESNTFIACYHYLSYSNGDVNRKCNYKSGGYSVRCLRD